MVEGEKILVVYQGVVHPAVVDMAFLAGSPGMFGCLVNGGPWMRVFGSTENLTWVRGWEGEIPDAFRAQVALLNGA